MKYDIRYPKLEVVVEVFRLVVITFVANKIFGLCVNPDSVGVFSLFCIAVKGNEDFTYFYIADKMGRS